MNSEVAGALTADRHFGDFEALKDSGNTHGDSHDQWRFSPMLDSNSFNLPISNQTPGCFTPSQGSSSMYHNQAGDLHTPNMGFGLGTPLSLSACDSQLNPGSTGLTMHGVHPHLLGSNSMQAAAPFPQQQSYAPSSFVHQIQGYESMSGSHNATPKQEIRMDLDSRRESNVIPFPIRTFPPSTPTSVGQPTEK